MNTQLHFGQRRTLPMNMVYSKAILENKTPDAVIAEVQQAFVDAGAGNIIVRPSSKSPHDRQFTFVSQAGDQVTLRENADELNIYGGAFPKDSAPEKVDDPAAAERAADALIKTVLHRLKLGSYRETTSYPASSVALNKATTKQAAFK